MLMNRRTFVIRRGQFQEAVALMREAVQPATAAFLERWQTVTETGGTNEIWRVLE